jgi:hypothetical protein
MPQLLSSSLKLRDALRRASRNPPRHSSLVVFLPHQEGDQRQDDGELRKHDIHAPPSEDVSTLFVARVRPVLECRMVLSKEHQGFGRPRGSSKVHQQAPGRQITFVEPLWSKTRNLA